MSEEQDLTPPLAVKHSHVDQIKITGALAAEKAAFQPVATGHDAKLTCSRSSATVVVWYRQNDTSRSSKMAVHPTMSAKKMLVECSTKMED
jgi:hypothetical protein